jgi:hypothetical protein
MATAPDAPNIFIRPKATDSALEFYWQPGNSNGADILEYILSDTINPDISLSNADRYYKATGLTNKTDYSYSLAASNSVGLGPAAAFRIVQPGLKPEQPTFVSIYRNSETSAKLSWFNQSASVDDSNTPTPWRNVIVAPRLTNGKLPYAGDDSVTATAHSLFGTDTSGNIQVAVDASYNFIVRAANDPGYSLPYNGTGPFSLKATTYSGDAFLNRLELGNFQNRANYIIKKNIIGPVQNADQSATLFNSATVTYTANQRGFTVYSQRDTNYDGPVKVLDKHGFVKFSSPFLKNVFADTGEMTRTNPIVPIVSETDTDDLSILPFAVYDYNTNTSLVSTIQEPGFTFATSVVKNNLDNNALITLLGNGANYISYVIEAGSKNPVLKYIGNNTAYITESAINKEMFVIQNSFDLFAKQGRLLYIPNSGSPVLYNIESINIGGLNLSGIIYPLSSKKVVMCAVDNDTNSNAIYTFDFNSTPSYTRRFITTNNPTVLYTSNSFSNFYKGYTNSAVSFIDNDGAGTYSAISPIASNAALQFTGSGVSFVQFTSNAQFTGTMYSNDTTNFFFTGVGLNGGADTKEMTYGPFGGPYNSTSITGFTYQNLVQTPHYSVFQYTDGGGIIRPFILTKYNSGTNQFDVSGVDLSGNVAATSDNSGVNFVSVDTVNKTYKYSTTLWPPVEFTTPYIGTFYGTYPRSSYTFMVEYSQNTIFHIYNSGTFDISGTYSGIGLTAAGPDCWYFISADGTNIYATRINTSGTKIYQTFTFTNDGTIYGAKASATGFICKVQYNSTDVIVVDFDVNRNTFNFTPFNTNTNGFPDLNSTYSTYLPNIEAV